MLNIHYPLSSPLLRAEQQAGSILMVMYGIENKTQIENTLVVKPYIKNVSNASQMLRSGDH